MKKLFASILVSIIGLTNIGFAQTNPLESTLSNAIEVGQNTATTVIKDNGVIGQNQGGTITNTILYVAMTYIAPLLVIVGVIVAIVGIVGVMTSDNPKSTQKGMSYIIWGVAGILIIFSSVFIAGNLSADLRSTFDPSGSNLIDGIINSFFKVIYPFINLLFYIIPGILFLILLANCFQYLTAQNDDAVKKSTSTIMWSITGIVLIIGASFMVNAIYGKGGTQVLSNVELSYGYKVLNWVLSFVFIAMVIIIIYQAYLMISKPDDASRFDKIRKSMLYMFIGIVIIGGAYLLVNFAIIRPTP